jgi:hypothetical protein
MQNSAKAGASERGARASIYGELFAAFGVAHSALLAASTEDTLEGELTEQTKKVAWDSLNALGRLIAQTSFMLPQAMLDALEEMNDSRFGMTWSEHVDQLVRVRDRAYVVARRDVGADVI